MDIFKDYRIRNNLPDILCCLCGKICETKGHHPYPLVDRESDKKCCNVCNGEKVIPARMALWVRKKYDDGTYHYGNCQ
jgi:hypothetical protein